MKWWLIGLLLALCASAQSPQVFIVNVHFADNTFTITDILQKSGFYPDRKLQPETGHRLEVISRENELLYSFRFTIPDKIFTDGSQSGEMIGGIVVLNETDFAFTLPYDSTAQEIRIVAPDRQEVASFTVGPTLSPQNRVWFSALASMVLLGAAVLLYWRKHHA